MVMVTPAWVQRLQVTGLLAGVLLIGGCASWKVNQAAAELASVGPGATLERLESIQVPDRDRAQYLLNTGILKLYLGDWSGSREDLQAAKRMMQSLQAVSVSENFAAITTNETLRSYDGTPTDRVLVHEMLALGYLFSGDLDGARVEMLQANVTMQTLAGDDSTRGQLASARFLAGVVYERQGEWDDALISYRHAYRILRERGETIPEALQISLLNLTRRQGFADEYRQLQQAFGREAQLPETGEGEWILLYFDAVVSRKTESRISVYNAEVDTMISVVMPQYPQGYYQPRHLTLAAAEQRQRSEVIENLEARAREDLAAEQAKHLAAATVRAVAKYKMVQKAQSQNDIGGVLMNIASVATEQADIRSWNMLPASLQVARLRAPATAPVQLLETGQPLPALQALGSRRLALVMASSLTDHPFIYPPPPASAVTPAPDATDEKGEFHEAP